MTDHKFPFFSIIIPTSNSSGTLKACLDSLAVQTFTDFEVIIIDNASRDTTLEVINSFYGNFTIQCISEKDEGIYDAMNKGIRRASGSYIYFLGSDDSLYNGGVLRAIRDIIRASAADIVYGNVMMRGEHECISDGTVHAGEFDLKRLISHNICHQSVFYHSSVFEKIGNYNLKYRVFADHDLNLRCAAKYKFHYTDMVVANFNLGGTSAVLLDKAFEEDRCRNIVMYFWGQLHTRAFVDLRLYVQQAALTKRNGLSLLTRFYCLLVYGKLKLQSLIR